MSEATYESIRKAAEVHRRVRQDAQQWIKPGMKLIDVCRRLEANNKHLVKGCYYQVIIFTLRQQKGWNVESPFLLDALSIDVLLTTPLILGTTPQLVLMMLSNLILELT